MSAKFMGAVWDLDLPHNEMLVLLAYADHADDSGRSAFPSVALVAHKTGYDERQVQRIISSLVDKQILVAEGDTRGGRGRTTIYSIHPENGVKKSPFDDGRKGVKKSPFPARQTPLKDDKMSPLDTDENGVKMSPITDIKGDKMPSYSDVKGDISDTERVTFRTVKGDISDDSLIRNGRAEPFEPSIEAAATRARVREELPAAAAANSIPLLEQTPEQLESYRKRDASNLVRQFLREHPDYRQKVEAKKAAAQRSPYVFVARCIVEDWLPEIRERQAVPNSSQPLTNTPSNHVSGYVDPGLKVFMEMREREKHRASVPSSEETT